MARRPKLDLDKFQISFQAIDTHTVGELTRVIFSGFPELKGDTMMARKNFLAEHYDKYRRALMHEPHGHHDMFGSYVCEPCNPEADYGVIFMDTGEYLNMCGHGTLGTVTALIETGMVDVKEPVTVVTLDTPAGLIRTRAEVRNGKAVSVSLTNVPSFLYKKDLKTVIDGQEITYDIAYGGSFFALCDTTQIGVEIKPENIPALTDFGMQLTAKADAEQDVSHPELDITSVDLVNLYGPSEVPECHSKNVVIFGDRMADRSPSGTATSARIAALYEKGLIKKGEEFANESFIGSRFKSVIKETARVGDFDAVIVEVTGSAYILSEATYVIDEDDPLKYGFVVG